MSITRQNIITLLIDKLDNITTANGYHTNIGNNVAEWSASAMEPSEDATKVIVKDVGQDWLNESANPTTGKHLWSLQIQIMVVSADVAPTVQRQMLADIYKAIGVFADDRNYHHGCYPIADEFDVVQNENKVFEILVQIRVDYETGDWSES